MLTWFFLLAFIRIFAHECCLSNTFYYYLVQSSVKLNYTVEEDVATYRKKEYIKRFGHVESMDVRRLTKQVSKESVNDLVSTDKQDELADERRIILRTA